MKLSLLAAVLPALCTAAPEESWQEIHMRVEHGTNFDPKAFFIEHDVDNSKQWTRSDVIRIYGLQKDEIVGDGSGIGSNEETKVITDEIRDNVFKTVLDLLDLDKDGLISMDEWMAFCESGHSLPDFGFGTGHHGDYEHEYEVHHWREFHAENDPDVLIQHPEDIEHEKLFHQHEHNDDGWSEHHNLDVRIPKKFRKEL